MRAEQMQVELIRLHSGQTVAALQARAVTQTVEQVIAAMLKGEAQ